MAQDAQAAADFDHVEPKQASKLPQNVSAVKGKVSKKVPDCKKCDDPNKGKRRMTMLEQPVLDAGRFEALTMSAVKGPKEAQAKKSVLVQGPLNDFRFDDFE